MSVYSDLILSESSLQSYWRLGEASGTTATDSKGSNNGTYSGTLTLAQAGALSGDANTSVSFGGGNVNIGDVFDFVGTAAFSVEFWMKPTTIDATGRRIVSKENIVTNRQGWGIRLGSSITRSLEFVRYTGVGSNTNAANPPSAPTTGSWWHVVCTYDGTTMLVYLNGTAGTGVASSVSDVDHTQPLRLADDSRGTATNPYLGLLDEVAIYNAALSSAQVSNHYNAGLSPAKTFSASQASSGAVSRQAGLLRNATQAESPALTRQAQPVRSAAQGSAGIFSQSVGAIRSATEATAATIARVVAKALSATQASAATIATPATLNRAFSASVSTVASVARQFVAYVASLIPVPVVPLGTKPPLGLAVEITDPSGATQRFDGSARAIFVPEGINFRTLRGDGFADASFVLRRRIDRDWPDIALFNDVAIVSDDGTVVYEGRIAAQPRSFDGGHSITVQCAGWMAHAKDRKLAYIGIDQDFNQWVEPPLDEKVRLATAGEDIGTLAWAVNGMDGLALAFPNGTLGANATAEAWYAAPSGVNVAKIIYQGQNQGSGNTGVGLFGLSDSDSGPGDTYTPVLNNALQTLTPTTARRFAYIAARPRSGQVISAGWLRTISRLAVIGDHGLTVHPALDTTMPGGLYVSDVIRDVFGRYCPMISTAGVQDTNYPVGQIAYRDRLFPYDVLQDLNKYHLWLPGVWENKTLHYGPADLTDYDWAVRLSDPNVKVELTGDTTDNLANGIAVEFTDIQTGRPAVVSWTDYTQLQDTRIDNPANDQPYPIEASFQLSFPCSTDDALQIGTAVLAEANQPNGTGTITIEGYATDRAGHLQPVSRIRAHDTIAILDHPNDRPRLIVETPYNHGGPGTAPSVTLGIDSTLKRLDAYVDRITTALAAANVAP